MWEIVLIHYEDMQDRKRVTLNLKIWRIFYILWDVLLDYMNLIWPSIQFMITMIMVTFQYNNNFSLIISKMETRREPKCNQLYRKHFLNKTYGITYPKSFFYYNMFNEEVQKLIFFKNIEHFSRNYKVRKYHWIKSFYSHIRWWRFSAKLVNLYSSLQFIIIMTCRKIKIKIKIPFLSSFENIPEMRFCLTIKSIQ